jgi:hypothetical protein
MRDEGVMVQCWRAGPRRACIKGLHRRPATDHSHPARVTAVDEVDRQTDCLVQGLLDVLGGEVSSRSGKLTGQAVQGPASEHATVTYTAYMRGGPPVECGRRAESVSTPSGEVPHSAYTRATVGVPSPTRSDRRLASSGQVL